MDDVKCPSIFPQYTAQRQFTVNEAIWWAKFGHKNLMAALNRRPGRINGRTSVTLITCFIIQWEKLHLVIHERCQWDLGSREDWDTLTAGSVQVQSWDFPFFSSRSRQKCICLPHPTCVLFLKIGNKRNGLRLCCSDSSWEIRSFF